MSKPAIVKQPESGKNGFNKAPKCIKYKKKSYLAISKTTNYMKKLLLILCLGCTVNLTYAQEQTPQSVQDSHHTILGYIKGGKVTDANNNFLGDFSRTGGNTMITVSDKNHKVIGYVLQDKVVQDADHKILGYINFDGRGTNTFSILNAENKPVGTINSANGSVMDQNHSLIGYEIHTEVSWAAPYFFFFNKFN